MIQSNLEYIEKDIKNLLNEENYKENFKISFGQNYFPKKEYKGIEYNEGYYESLVVKLGRGNGHNGWCILFPPLCLIEANESDTNNIEYKSIIKEIIDTYL